MILVSMWKNFLGLYNMIILYDFYGTSKSGTIIKVLPCLLKITEQKTW
jgi:hypothetical protein